MLSCAMNMNKYQVPAFNPFASRPKVELLDHPVNSMFSSKQAFDIDEIYPTPVISLQLVHSFLQQIFMEQLLCPRH